MQMAKGKRVLICEDEGLTALAFRNALLSAGYDVVGQASEGEAVVALARQLQPDLILMDINLQGSVSGIEATGQILREQNVAIIVITVYSDDPHIQAALSTGACGYLVKPVSKEQLLVAIDVCLDRFVHIQTILLPLEKRQRNKEAPA